MYDAAISIVGLITIFCATVIALFFVIGRSMDYAWRKYQDAVGFAKLSRCYRLVRRIEDRKKRRGAA